MDDRLEQQFNLLSKKYNTLLTQNQSLKVSMQQADNKVKEVEEQLKNEMFTHEKDLEQVKMDIDYLTKQNHSLKQELQVYKHSGVEEELKLKDETNQELIVKYKDILEENYRDLEKLKEYENIIKEMKEELEFVHKENENLQRTLKNYESYKQKAANEAAMLRREKEELEEVFKEQNKEVAKIVKGLVNKEDDNRFRQEEFKGILKKNQILEKKNKELQQNYNKALKEISDKNDRLNVFRQLKLTLENKLKEESSIKEKLNERILELEKKMSLYTRISNNHMCENNIELDYKLSETERKLKDLLEKIEPLMEKNSQLENIVEQQKNQIEKLQLQKKQLNSTIMRLKFDDAQFLNSTNEFHSSVYLSPESRVENFKSEESI
ncbi:unnamed protein product [Blepharisma stoltei]|uniref:Uncharacterized protein n=1 Tax=Blepharisma stoltei TaxID=1481888 RepID=A0AAU9IJY4_9CILI|nr:unnamed protein product [Blepharisma stoltei]